MVSRERREEILKGLREGVVAFDEEAVRRLSKAAIEEGIDAYEAIMKGLAQGMEKVGELYIEQKYFVPELVLCSDALYTGLEILRPHIKKADSRVSRSILLGVVEGDIHDIGKNLVKAMFDAEGWTVHDLGNDVKLERFVEEQKRLKPDIIALSALMTTSMLGMPKVISMLREQEPNATVIVGGAPLSRTIAKQFGADGYAPTAAEAVQEAVQILTKKGKR